MNKFIILYEKDLIEKQYLDECYEKNIKIMKCQCV